jgi:hypothetical protein
MDTGIGRGLTEIAGMLIGVALIALLVGHSSGTVAIINAGGNQFANLLGVVTLQNSYGNSFNI